jgi:hypothetical protein
MQGGVGGMLARAAFAIALAAALAGCSNAPQANGPGLGSEDDPGDDAVVSLDAAAPEWQVGQWWEWETSFGGETRPDTFRSVVAQAASGGYVLASDQDGMAKEEAAFGHPLLGEVSASLSLEGFGGTWDFLDFPLTDGKTWQATIPNIASDILGSPTATVAMRADHDPDLPGYRIMGHVDQGMLLEATYLPETGWFGEVLLYDLDPSQEEVEVGLRAVSAGLNFTGTAYTATAEELLILNDGSGLDAPPPEGQPFLQPEPSGSFTMAADTLLYGVLAAESVLGGRVITLTDPANQQRQLVSQGGPDGDEQLLWVDEEGVAGEWHVVTSGAGGFTYAYVELYEITLTETAF